MSRINVLDKSTINQIAAGEVIDRPASIIKELVENSIDAGATAVSVEIKGGGIDLIRITDNGSGILKDDIRVAFVRHTTSKIKTADDLSYITSLGFRGEALASIAAVADVELITKTKEDFSAVRYLIGGGEEKAFEEIGAPDGTTFIIRDVFKYVPVRRKFLKSSATEGSYCNEVVERIALSHPEVSVKYVNNGRNIIFTNGSSRMKDIIFGIYGRDVASEIVELDHTGSKDIHVSGCICRPTVVRSNRNTENYFVNGRFIRSPIVFKAIEDAYQPFLMQHKYPFTALYIDIDPSRMDVNVHPSKQEVRFENPEAVYNTVFTAITEALSEKALIHKAERDNSMAKKDEEEKKKYVPEPFEVVRKEKDSVIVKDRVTDYTAPVKTATGVFRLTETGTAEEIKKVAPKQELNELRVPEETEIIQEPVKMPVNEAVTSEVVSVKEEIQGREETSDRELPKETYREEQVKGTYKQANLFDNEDYHIGTRSEFNTVFSSGYRIVGQMFDTYWIIESGGCAYIIDQHAAHEKILYEKFMQNIGKDRSTQLLSPPLIVSLSSQEEAVAEEYGELLGEYGFVLEHFGGHEYALSEIPLNLYGIDAKDMLLEILEELAKDIKGSVIKSIKEKIATCACKAAVKGNTELKEEEAKELIKQLLAAENPFNCPHGRPIIIDVTKREIEKKFKRIV